MSDRRVHRGSVPRRNVRRRPGTSGSLGNGPRPDRIAAWAFLLGVFLILVAATTSHGATGGSAAPGTNDRAAVNRPAPLSQQLGRTTLREGSTGQAVSALQSILNAKGFGELDESGAFDPSTAAAVKKFQAKRGLTVDGIVGPRTRPALLRLMIVRTATWYGPGFYGKRTACGRKLTRRTQGVAHKTLPCGTRVTFYRHGRFVTVPVIDRGPFVRGVSWDLTEATARRLATLETARVRSVHQARARR